MNRLYIILTLIYIWYFDYIYFILGGGAPRLTLAFDFRQTKFGMIILWGENFLILVKQLMTS